MGGGITYPPGVLKTLKCGFLLQLEPSYEEELKKLKMFLCAARPRALILSLKATVRGML